MGPHAHWLVSHTFARSSGLLFSLRTWLIGVPWHDAAKIGGLLGTRMTINEFVAFAQLGTMKGALDPRTFTIATFALCGFADFSSIGNQIGGIGALAPNRRGDLARLASALCWRERWPIRCRLDRRHADFIIRKPQQFSAGSRALTEKLARAGTSPQISQLLRLRGPRDSTTSGAVPRRLVCLQTSSRSPHTRMMGLRADGVLAVGIKDHQVGIAAHRSQAEGIAGVRLLVGEKRISSDACSRGML